jgi:hypothetical protein
MNKHPEFYAHLGYLSVQFARMEQTLHAMIAVMVTDDLNYLDLHSITERMSISSLTDILKKLNRIKSFERELVDKILELVEKVRKNRNLFIHGIWSDPFVSEGKIMITCVDAKIVYEVKEEDGGRTQSWRTKKIPFTIDQINAEIETVMYIISLQESFIDKLEQKKKTQKKV